MIYRGRLKKLWNRKTPVMLKFLLNEPQIKVYFQITDKTICFITTSNKHKIAKLSSSYSTMF